MWQNSLFVLANPVNWSVNFSSRKNAVSIPHNITIGNIVHMIQVFNNSIWHFIFFQAKKIKLWRIKRRTSRTAKNDQTQTLSCSWVMSIEKIETFLNIDLFLPTCQLWQEGKNKSLKNCFHPLHSQSECDAYWEWCQKTNLEFSLCSMNTKLLIFFFYYLSNNESVTAKDFLFFLTVRSTG